MPLADVRNQQRGIEDPEAKDYLTGPMTDERALKDAWEQRRREWMERKDRERGEWEQDPLGYEKRQDWDRPGDVGRHPDIEWVPTHELKKFVEYDRRPGQQHATDPDRYAELAAHIGEQGFKNPVVLEYNEDTGMAHMGEGNHRTWIALEHGIPAMPVRVYRSRRPSATQIPVDLQPQPEWRDHMGDVRVPDSMRPSHIGLPVVPEPGWQTRMAARWPVEPSEGLEDFEGHEPTWERF